MSKISELSDGGALQSTDYLIAVRSGGNVKVQPNGTVTGTTGSFSGNVTFADNAKAIFGAGSDLQIYHTGAHSYIDDTGTGNLYLNSNGAGTIITGASETQAQFFTNGAVNLFYDNAVKLATTATGIDVTGTVTADGLTVDGSLATINSSGPNVDLVLTEGSTNTDARIRNSNGILEIDADLNNEFGNSSMVFAVDGTDKLKINNNGDISFYEDTGTTPKFFWDASAEALGIGTTSPNAPLTVQGGSATSPTIQLKGGSFGNDNASIQSLYNLTLKADSSEAIAGRTIGFAVGSTQAMTITSAGNVGIGTGSPSYKLDVVTASATQARFAYNSTNYVEVNYDGFNIVGGSMVFENAGSEKARIDSSGALLVGTTTSAGAGGVGLTGAFRAGYQGILNGFGNENVSGLFYSGGSSGGYTAINSNSGNAPLYVSLTSSATTGALINFADTGTGVGYISTNGTTTSYNTSSDARLKENIADAEDASNLVDAIKVRQFDWKADGSHQRYGMVAQELLEVAPEAVSQPEDPEAMMGVDYSKLVPMLVKEIQSLRARVAQLEGA